MCGRYSFAIPKEKIEQRFLIRIEAPLQYSYNIAPTHNAYVLTNENPHRLEYITWGLLPHWSRDNNNSGKLINARQEGIAGKPSFRMPIRKRRCLVLADSFYEWKKYGSERLPYRILPQDDDMLVMAGIWDDWQKDGKNVRTFSIITTSANQDVANVHSRMPLIFTRPEDWQRWLQDISLEEVLGLLDIRNQNILRYYRVSEKMNTPAHNSAENHIEVMDNPTLFDF